MDYSHDIEIILAAFNFQVVTIAMRAVCWEWEREGRRYFPNATDLEDRARQLLEQVVEAGNGCAATGGLTARMSDEGELSLDFVLEERAAKFGELLD